MCALGCPGYIIVRCPDYEIYMYMYIIYVLCIRTCTCTCGYVCALGVLTVHGFVYSKVMCAWRCPD